jgi:hypothetical protein
MKKATLVTLLLAALLAFALVGATTQIVRGRRPLVLGTT